MVTLTDIKEIAASPKLMIPLTLIVGSFGALVYMLGALIVVKSIAEAVTIAAVVLAGGALIVYIFDAFEKDTWRPWKRAEEPPTSK